MFIKTLSILFFLSLPALCSAEYRVYQYYIKQGQKQTRDKNAYLITTSLDPVTYLTYHGGGHGLKVDLLRTWMCKGHTGNGKDYCTPPLESIPPEKEI